MANYTELFEDNELEIVKEIKEIDNLQNIKIKVIGNNQLKTFAKVHKANEMLKYFSGEDVIIIINERMYESFDDEIRKIAIEEVLAQIYFDGERDKIVLVKPDVNTFSLILQKHGLEKYQRFDTCVKAFVAQMEEEAANA